MGPACRIHLHRECCRELDYSLEPKFNQKGQRVRICKDVTDSTFDIPLKELFNSGIINKTRTSRFVFYKLTENRA